MMDDTSVADAGNWPRRGGEGASFRPFGVHWLDSALQETLLPGTPWEQVEEKVSRGLVGKLRSSQEFKDMEKKQMILQLLGAKFVERYLKDELYVPNILEPPRITLLKRQQLQRSMQKLLKDKLDDVARFHDYLPGTPDGGGGGGESSQRGESSRQQMHSVEMRATQEHMTTVFQNGLDRHMVMNGFTADQVKTDNIPDPSLASMNCWSGTSNLLGHSLCAILQRDPNRLGYICKRLGGKQLPASLREFLWAEVLLRHSDSTVHTEKTTEKSLRKTFAKMVSKGKLELKISKATECPISGLIKKAVQEKYENTVCMQQYKGTVYTSQCSEALNVLYTYNRSYEPYLVHWLFPLQVAFQDIGSEQEDRPYELAFYLNLLQSNTFPHWPEIYAIAEQAMARLHSGDQELYQHLQTCSTTNVKVDPKEFMVQLLEDERKKAASFSWATQPNVSSTDGLADNSKSLLANPVVFLRKWVGEGFGSVLDTQAVLFIWDQCFMSDWNRKVLEDVCLALVLLLKRDFMQAIDYHQMKQVFLLKPCKLYTADIQDAFKHLQAGGSASKVPDFDRRRLETTDVPATAREPYNPVPMSINTTPAQTIQTQKLNPVGLTNIHLNLAINQPDIRKAEDEESPQLDVFDQLINFQPERLSITVAIWHKGRILTDRKCESTGVMVQTPSLERGNPLNEDGHTKTYQVSFSSDLLTFNDVSIEASSYELSFSDNQPRALISVTYRLLGGQNYLPLGWSTLPLYEYQANDTPLASNGTYCTSLRVQPGKRNVPLFPGEAPEFIPLSTLDPDYEVNDHLQPGSFITTSCIDPSHAEIPSESTPPPQPEEPLWVPYDSDIGERLTPWKPDQGFDLYIDQVRFLPDNATIVKVKARIMQQNDKKVADILATPLLDSPSRCPQFEFRDTTEKAEETYIACFRVYTVDKATKELVALGAAMLPLYDEDHLLNVAGFQLPLHSGIPDKDSPLTVAALDKLPIVPGASLLVRLLPITKIFIPAPNYASGYYRNSYQSKPKQSHLTVMEHYTRLDNWVETVQDTIEQIQRDETEDEQNPQGGEEEAEVTPLGREELTEWMIDRLEESKHLPEGVDSPGDLDLTRCVNYDLRCGLYVMVHMTPCVKGIGLYTQAVCQVLPGRRASGLDMTSEGYGIVDRFHTKQHKYNSLQTAPQWKDPPKRIHPHYDTQSVLVVRLIGLTLLYNPDPNQEGPGVIKGKHGKKRVQIGPESYLGWTVLPMFDKGCVAQGSYILPVFQDDTSLDFLEDINRADNILTWLKTNIKKNVIKLHRQYATAVVSIFDGHFVRAEAVPLPKKDAYLDVDNFEKFAEAAQHDKNGPKMCQHILRGLPKEVQEEEMDSVLYQQEEKYFEHLALIVFDEALENVKEIGSKS